MSETVDNFLKAAKVKLRFQAANGQLAPEDLFDLDLTSQRKVSLNSLAQEIDEKIQQQGRKNFVPDANKPRNSELALNELRLEIIKEVIAIKVAENEARRNKAENEAQLSQLKELLASKEIDKFKAMSEEEIKAKIAALSASA